MSYLCIDVSKHNGIINWDEVMASGVKCAIIRLGYGSDLESQDDPQVIRNIQECERLCIPYGLYLYSYGLNIEQIRSEIAHALRIAKDYNPRLGIWFDMEDADSYKAQHGLVAAENGELLTDFCIEFMKGIRDAGYATGVYANRDYFVNILNDDRLTEFDGFNRWLAYWGIDEPSMDCLIWQYTSDGEVNGSSDRTDMNYYYGELPTMELQPEDDEQSEDNRQSDDTLYHEGDYVVYDTIYNSSTSEEGLRPSAGFTSGTITRVVPGAANPYLINDGTGWINDGSIISADNDDEQEETDEPIKEGDKVRVLFNVDYDTDRAFNLYYDEYDVIQINGDRAVIGIGNTVTSAIDVHNIERI